MKSSFLFTVEINLFRNEMAFRVPFIYSYSWHMELVFFFFSYSHWFHYRFDLLHFLLVSLLACLRIPSISLMSRETISRQNQNQFPPCDSNIPTSYQMTHTHHQVMKYVWERWICCSFIFTSFYENRFFFFASWTYASFLRMDLTIEFQLIYWKIYLKWMIEN